MLVLNRFYQAIRVINVKRAFSLLCKELAEVVHIETDRLADAGTGPIEELQQGTIERFLAKIDQQAKPVPAPVQVQQTLLHILRFDLAGGLRLQDQFIAVVRDQVIHPAPGYDYSIVRNGNLYLPLPGQAPFAQRNFQGPLVIHLHAVHSQLPLDILARPDDCVR